MQLPVLMGLGGRSNGKKLNFDTWVMNCRAFSRCMEYRCLEDLFTKFHADEIMRDYFRTERNSPPCEFLSEILGKASTLACAIRRRTVMARPESIRYPQEAIDG